MVDRRVTRRSGVTARTTNKCTRLRVHDRCARMTAGTHNRGRARPLRAHPRHPPQSWSGSLVFSRPSRRASYVHRSPSAAVPFVSSQVTSVFVAHPFAFCFEKRNYYIVFATTHVSRAVLVKSRPGFCPPLIGVPNRVSAYRLLRLRGRVRYYTVTVCFVSSIQLLIDRDSSPFYDYRVDG